MLSVARMMLAGANSGEGEPEARRAKELVTAGWLLLEAAAALLHESRRMDEVVQARKASLAPDRCPVTDRPGRSIDRPTPRGACSKTCALDP